MMGVCIMRGMFLHLFIRFSRSMTHSVWNEGRRQAGVGSEYSKDQENLGLENIPE